ncbi:MULTISPECIES: hypothetical protein [Flavobacterium]|jgi:hypothetical protein|uniref:Uncharacterized protein n=1 Tax=Flavobacterium cupriresistens TaxID=2893885 RepID=A0ABU4RG29_9FLAO|nr:MULTISPECIES: hypothetical protein [unclassified Flavobacterium]KLT69770.1 hypothetical protein AB674_10990 [Flavobacterium sp. ABG]MDX6189466.1 hypothetical protein [Flavobacterium sp. Fl-318]UFH41125.1 hypothetical protein LNP23_15040 [Flavobacterium sp. F-323]
MKSDFYTKFILTVIAICLSILTLKSIDFIPKAYGGSLKSEDKKPLLNTNYALVPVNSNGTIDVNIKSSSMLDVNVSKVTTSDELEVNITEVAGSSLLYGAVPVKIKQ